MPYARTSWQVHDVEVITELSTSGVLIGDAGITWLPFIDTNGDGVGDLWAITSSYANMRWSVTNNAQNIYSTVAGTATQRGNLRTRVPAIAGSNYRIDLTYRRYSGYTGTGTRTNSSVTIRWYSAADLLLSSTSPMVNNDTQNEWQSVSYFVLAPATTAYATVEVSSYAANTTGMVLNDVFGTTFTDMEWVNTNLPAQPLTWRNISCDVKGMSIRHGRARFTDRFDVGSLSVSLTNRDGEYAYSPDHEFGLRPGRILRVTAKYNGSTYPMFYGVIDSITDGYAMDGAQVVLMVANDVTTVTSNRLVPSVTGYRESLSGARINTLLDLIGYNIRNIDPGQFIQQVISQSGRTVRDEMGVSADSEGGNVYGERDGRVMYRDRTWETYDPRTNIVQANVLATVFEDDFRVIGSTPTAATAPVICPNELETDWSLARVINEVTLSNRGGSAQEFEDTQSVRDLGPRGYTRLDFVNRDSSTLAVRADDYLLRSSQAVLRLNSLSYNPALGSGLSWPFTLSVFLNWCVRIAYQHPTNGWGWQIVTHVQSVLHEITPTSWSVTCALDNPISYYDYPVGEDGFGWDVDTWDEDLWDTGGQTKWSAGFKWSDPLSKWNA